MDAPDFKELAAAMEHSSLQERVMVVLLTLATEYEARAIDKDRFAKRCYETLIDYAKRVKRPDAAPEQGEKK
mgnify:CR=1 FL=1